MILYRIVLCYTYTIVVISISIIIIITTTTTTIIEASPEPFEALPGMEAPPLPRGTPAPGEEGYSNNNNDNDNNSTTTTTHNNIR